LVARHGSGSLPVLRSGCWLPGFVRGFLIVPALSGVVGFAALSAQLPFDDVAGVFGVMGPLGKLQVERNVFSTKGGGLHMVPHASSKARSVTSGG
jgi:hypothetical protein